MSKFSPRFAGESFAEAKRRLQNLIEDQEVLGEDTSWALGQLAALEEEERRDSASLVACPSCGCKWPDGVGIYGWGCDNPGCGW
jgi:hypothetical protein